MGNQRATVTITGGSHRSHAKIIGKGGIALYNCRMTFPETADIESSTEAYAQRFAGPTGEWMLNVQERCLLELAAGLGPGLSALDVGGGHAQVAPPLVAQGHRVTVLGSAAECELRLQAALDAEAYTFEVGNMIELPYPDDAFDLVTSFRIVTHCGQWERLIAELCRVARKGVIIDYPTSQSINRVAPWLFEAKKKVEQNTRVWHQFTHAEIQAAFASNQFELAVLRKQFFFPMVVHRLLKLRPLSIGLESVARVSGLTKLAGSPVVALFTPKGS